MALPSTEVIEIRSLDPEKFDGLLSEVLGRGCQFRFRVQGQSMYPWLQSGDIVTVEPVKPQELRKGEVVFYRGPAGDHVAHRLLGRADGSLILRGDNRTHNDSPVLPESVLGRVTMVARQGCGHRLNGKGGRALGWLLASFNWGLHPVLHKLQRGLVRLWYRATGEVIT